MVGSVGYPPAPAGETPGPGGGGRAVRSAGGLCGVSEAPPALSGAAPSLPTVARRPVQLLLAAILVGVLAIALPGAVGGAATAPSVVRNALAQTATVQGAPDRTLVLSRVTVAPGAELALHHHLGTQVARVESGVLTYTVRRGGAVVRSGESDRQPPVVRSIRAGQTGRIRAGQWIVEQPSTIHQAANRGEAPVVIYLATLLKTGAPPSTPVTLP
jgi:quercetin dioxygenase-like cupin family protein